MSSAELKNQLHQVIDRVSDVRVLEAVYTLLVSSEEIPKPVTHDDIEDLLEASEIAIFEGRTIEQNKLRQEMNSWRIK